MENPYSSRNMIKDNNHFFGRQEEIEQVFTNLNNGFQNTSIVGERRIGKSSLLWHISRPDIYREFEKKGDKPFLFIFFDLQSVAGLNQQSFFRILTHHFIKQLPIEPVLKVDDFDSHQEFFMELVEEYCESYRIVICLDEFETVSTSKDFNAGFLQGLRSFANLGQIAYITSSRDHLEQITQQTDHIMGSDFWNIFIMPPLYLSLLTEAEALELVTLPAQKAGNPFTKDEMNSIIHMAGYHPLFLQIACYYLFDMKSKKLLANQAAALDSVEMKQMINDFTSAAEPHFKQSWKQLSEVEKNVLVNCNTIDPEGQYRNTVNIHVHRGLLLPGPPLKPFCTSFFDYIQNNNFPQRDAQEASIKEKVDKKLAQMDQDTSKIPTFFLNNAYKLETSRCNRLNIWISQSGQILLDLEGNQNISHFCNNKIQYDSRSILTFNERVQSLPKNEDWRLHKKLIGDSVQDIFQAIPELSQFYSEGSASCDNDEHFIINFKCPIDMLSFPFEFINSLSSFDEGQKHLTLSHPTRKSIMGIRTRKKPLNPDFYLDKEVKILLVGSNTHGAVNMNEKDYQLSAIPGAVQEVQNLAQMIDQLNKNENVNLLYDLKIDISAAEMAELLQHGQYDIVHYSGHSFFAETPENSCLFFWDSPKMECIEKITATGLNTIVERSNIKFFYLSCCQGAAMEVGNQVIFNDFLGIIHSLLVAGVPAILAMRWPLSDQMAMLLASSFYKELFAGKGLDHSLFYARKQVQNKNTNDYTWLSPILVVQGN
jgi:CHAT domain/Novel STAND NTPase 2